ncbi:hypothetical protein L4174_022325 [Photobacterium sp. CCB-ST2H9]|uniref:hypothetical protein n=1 Tax=Photobacterium sp. CCB-ST2H9 TaxID=2912855 RepID=UPI00200327CF|nr:hypothetical protein [Photobacterium sp. CCB-ST2H9]UTM59436.1 hypothetical protein L4174_022325 [Photobacterium sp. CCB-ST2H9]
MKKILNFLNRDLFPIKLHTASVIVCSVLALFFDLWQLVTSSNEFLVWVSLICLTVTAFGWIQATSSGFNLYLLAYIVPAALLAIAHVPGGEHLGINSGDFITSAYASLISALFPLIVPLITVPCVLVISSFTRWLEQQSG